MISNSSSAMSVRKVELLNMGISFPNFKIRIAIPTHEESVIKMN